MLYGQGEIVLIVLSLSRTYRTKFKLPSQGALRAGPQVTVRD